MIIISFNCRGLARTQKKLALKNLFKFECCDVIILQETVGVGETVIKSLSNMLPSWSFVSIDANGRFGGLAMGLRDINIKILNSWGSDLVLGAEVYSSNLCSNLTLINIYGLCQERALFWNNVFSKSLLNNSKVVLGGDLN